jgi:DNA repair protein RecO (recombination protein O)
MQWQDSAIILSSKKLGEGHAIVTVFSRERGLSRGLVRGISSQRNRGMFQPGTLVEMTWKARLAEQLGTISAEMIRPYSAMVLHDITKLFAMCSACALIECTLAEREQHTHLFEDLNGLLESIVECGDWLAEYVQFELMLLRELGFGLDLSMCVATGGCDDLCYVSPRSGRAVSRIAGHPYRDRLLLLPAFLRDSASESRVNKEEIKNGLALTGFFLNKYAIEPHGWKMPSMRARFEAAVAQENRSFESITELELA